MLPTPINFFRTMVICMNRLTVYSDGFSSWPTNGQCVLCATSKKNSHATVRHPLCIKGIWTTLLLECLPSMPTLTFSLHRMLYAVPSLNYNGRNFLLITRSRSFEMSYKNRKELETRDYKRRTNRLFCSCIFKAM